MDLSFAQKTHALSTTCDDSISFRRRILRRSDRRAQHRGHRLSRFKGDRHECRPGSGPMDSRAGSAADGTESVSSGRGRCCDRPGQPVGAFPRSPSAHTDRVTSTCRQRESRVGLHVGCSGSNGPLWAGASVRAEHPTNVREGHCPRRPSALRWARDGPGGESSGPRIPVATRPCRARA